VKVFVTVGSMLPFDRLVGAMDRWAAAHREAEVFAQIGEGGVPPAHMRWSQMLIPSEFRRHCETCDVIVSHAGMGTILSAGESGRPLVCLPRRPELKEVTSQHQVATARWLRERPGIRVVDARRSCVARPRHVAWPRRRRGRHRSRRAAPSISTARSFRARAGGCSHLTHRGVPASSAAGVRRFHSVDDPKGVPS